MKLSEHKIDVQKQEEGGWVDNIPELDGLRLKVRGANNKDWRKLFGRLVDAVPRKRRVGGRLDPADQDRITSVCLRDTCLLDWDGIEGDDNKPIPYSKDQADKYLTNPEYSKFRDGVLWAANVVAEQEVADLEEDVGN
jgi:hypothetical protein